jgi:hypothetical protein
MMCQVEAMLVCYLDSEGLISLNVIIDVGRM